MEKLRSYLASISFGPITDVQNLETLLGECWAQINGGTEEGMYASKLLGRMENTPWDPPVLSFEIERHGRILLGSSRADLQRWEIDINQGSAICRVGGMHQLYPMQPGLDVKPIAKEILKWLCVASRTRV